MTRVVASALLVSFHLFDLPGYPASHACVRLLLRDAQWLYGWGEQWKLDDPAVTCRPGRLARVSARQITPLRQ